ncbi:MAG TPA: plasmid recombination protein [Sphingobium sp.]|uniref:plasmid recombination protein n=1 Tax=Sphingobium sp. TaxID=1912891 RepID=UPI002ED6547D
MSYQFLHVETYSRKGAHKKNSSARKSSMFDIRDEMIRAPHACSHVAEPQTPCVLFGMTPDETFALANEQATRAVDKRGYKLRCDAPVVLVGVTSWPDTVADLNSDPVKWKRYRQWRDEAVAWLKRQWGDNLKTVVQHLDEARPHIHFVVVPMLSLDRRLPISSIHPGHRAAEKTAEANGTGRDQKKAYKEAMVGLQDDYYERVSVKLGLLRIGPRLPRLTRAEWKEKKRQALALAQAHTDVQTLASNVKAIAKSQIATQAAEAEQAALAKIDAITAQSHHRITMLKQKAIERISGLKGRVNELEGAMSKKDAIIAAQAAELEAVIGILRDNGLARNLGI